LYSDREETIFEAQRPVILTSIEDLATRSDLLDRGIVLTLPPIQEKNRVTESDLWAEFDRILPTVLGSLLDVPAGALKRLPGIRLEKLPRMADFATLGVAVEQEMGWPEGKFIEAYNDNRHTAHTIALENSPIVPPLVELAKEARSWKGTPAELLKELARRVGEKVTAVTAWPKSASSLSGKCRHLAPNLVTIGVEVKFDRTNGMRLIYVDYVADEEIL
jgi:hypothetical protein